MAVYALAERVGRIKNSAELEGARSGPPVLLLHGHPRTHTTWEWVAPLLAAQFTVICPDLRGYGESSEASRSSRWSQLHSCSVGAPVSK